MAVVTFQAQVTLDGRVYRPGQTTEIADHWVYPLLRQHVITCPGVYEKAYEDYEAAAAKTGLHAPAPVITSRDPRAGDFRRSV